MIQASFFDLSDRSKKLDERDPLFGLNKLIDWEAFDEAYYTSCHWEFTSDIHEEYEAYRYFGIILLQSLYPNGLAQHDNHSAQIALVNAPNSSQMALRRQKDF